MEKSCQHNLQACLHAKRRTSLGSISSRKRNNNSMSYDQVTSNYPPPPPNYLKTPTQRKLRPIAGGSWDDNSVGYGSVVSRMRRDRHRAIIRRTQATSSTTTDGSASVENTLNLINTTDISPPWHEENPFGWDDDDLADFYGQQQTVATKRSAGSLCNISSSHNRLIGEGGTYRPWDSQSIPENRRKMMREKLKNSFNYSGGVHHHHSSPTSGCASIASSDIESGTSFFSSINDDNSSLFDGDSLFSDSYGFQLGDHDSGFSTDIFSLLEDGNISCRTPFPVNGDWPDSISELNFDYNNEQYISNITNCDAHSDIMPSSSLPSTTENRLKKRKLRTKSINHGKDPQKCGVFPDSGENKMDEEVERRQQETDKIAVITKVLRRRQQVVGGGGGGKLNDQPTTPLHQSTTLLPPTTTLHHITDDALLDASAIHSNQPAIKLTTTKQHRKSTQSSTESTTSIPTTSAVINLQLDLNLNGNHDVTNIVINSVHAASHKNNGQQQTSTNHQQHNNSKVESPSSPALKKAFKISTASMNSGNTSGFTTPIRLPITLNLKGWNYMNKDERESFIERLSHKISTTMSIEEQLDIIGIIKGEKTIKKSEKRNSYDPTTRLQSFHMSVDDIDSHKLIKLLGYLDKSGGAALNGLFSAPTMMKTTTQTATTKDNSGSGGIRRSNSDGNLNITTAGIEQNKQTNPRYQRGKSQVCSASGKNNKLTTTNNNNMIIVGQQQQTKQQRNNKLQQQRIHHKGRQLIREQQSGLFINEQKMQINNKQEVISSEDEEICVDI